MGGAPSVSRSPKKDYKKEDNVQTAPNETVDNPTSPGPRILSPLRSSHTLVQKFSFSSRKKGSESKVVSFKDDERSLQVVDLEKDLFHAAADDSHASTQFGTNSTNVLSPNPSVGNFLSVVSSEDDHDDDLDHSFTLTSGIKDLSQQLISEKAARELFVRFIKDNAAKWVEQIGIQAQFKSNLSSQSKLVSSPPCSPTASNSNTPSSNPASPKGSIIQSNNNGNASQYFSSTTLNFHSFTVTKSMLHQQNQGMTWSFDSSRKEAPALEDDESERYHLDIINLMKQLKVKDSIEANAIYAANSRSFDSYDNSTVLGEASLSGKSGCTVGKSSLYLERIFSREAIEAYFYAILLPLFAQSSQFVTLREKKWSSDLLQRLQFAPPSSSSSNAGNYVQDFRITNLIQQTRTQQKNESLANIQQLFYALSKELTAEQIHATLSSSKWLDIIPNALTDCPIGVVFCRNENGNHNNAPTNENSVVYMKEPLPIVFTNRTMTTMTGYAKQELLGKNLSMLLPKKDLKVLQFPHPPPQQQQHNQHAGEYYNDKRLIHKYLDYNNKGEKCKVGIIKEKKNHEKFYDFISTIPIYKQSSQSPYYSYLLSLHYNLNDDEAKVSDFKVMDDLQCLLFLLAY